MATLSEMTVQVLTARLAKKEMSLEEMQQEINAIKKMIQGIEDETITPETPAEEAKPKLTIKQAFRKDEVICMICNKGFKTLKRHLSMAHDLKPGQYRKQFGIPATQSLTAKSYTESRRQTALDNNLADGLAKARANKAAKKAPVPAKRTKAAVPMVKPKAATPAIKKKAAVPAKVANKVTKNK